MKRSRQAIRKHLIRLGYISETYKNYSFVPEKYFYEYFMPSFNMVFLILFSLAMLLQAGGFATFIQEIRLGSKIIHVRNEVLYHKAEMEEPDAE